MYTRKKLKRVYAEWLQIRDGHLLTALSQRERSLHKDDTVLKFATVKQDVQAILEDCWPSQMQQRDKSEFFAWRRHNIDIAFKVAFSIKNWMLDAGISQQYIQDRAQEIQWLAYAQPNALTDHQWAAIVSMVSDWPESIACANAAMCARIIDLPSFKNMRTLEKYQLWSLTGVDALMATVFDVQIASKDASRALMALFIDDEAAKSYLDQWLSQASARGYRHVVERLATMLPNDFQVPTACLCEAAFSGNIEMIALLLQLPATDISRVDRAGNDPGILLAVGVQFGGYDVVKALLSHPQIPMVKKGVENRVVHYSSDVPFIHACATNDVALVDLFLRHANSTHKIDINQIYASKGYYATPLMIAIRNGQLDLAELLLGHTRTDCRSAHFCATPYSLALTLGHLRLAALILEKNPEVTHHLPSRLARIVHAWQVPLPWRSHAVSLLLIIKQSIQLTSLLRVSYLMLGLSRHWSVTRIDNIQPDSATQIASERHKITNICETFIFLSVLTYAVLRILDSTAKKVVDRETPLQSSDNHTTRMKR